MSIETSTIVAERKEANTPRTDLADLSPAGYELSQDELGLVAGGVGKLIWTKPLVDGDATNPRGRPD